ncbi:MAG: CRISPR-associated endonuclease Cas2 [Patescibacteria group bacterium]
MEQKIVLLLFAGVALCLTKRPDYYFRIIDSTVKTWKEINRRSLNNAVRRLYQSKALDYKKNPDGTVSVFLSKNGKFLATKGNLERISIPKPQRWDGYWRIVIFDIPEDKKKGRDALAGKLKKLGFYALQKSVFVYPYEFRKEVQSIADFFSVRKYVCFIVTKEIDADSVLRRKFNL